MKNVLKVMLLFVASISLSFVISQAAAASDTIYYFKLDTAYQDTHSDDFDGKFFGDFLNAKGEDTGVGVRLPKLDSGYGFGLTFGGIRGHIGGEIYYRQSNLDGSYMGGQNADSDYQEIGGNFKYYFLDFNKCDFNFYGLVGLAYTKLKAKNSSFTWVNQNLGLITDLEEGTFSGKSYNFGLGTTYRFADHFGFEAQYIYGINHIMRVRGSNHRGNRFDDITSDFQTFNLGMNYYF